MKVIHGSLPQDNEPSDFKTCPICGSICFTDMDTCFGCLHHFTDTDAAKTTPIPIMRGTGPSAIRPDQDQIPLEYVSSIPLQEHNIVQEQEQGAAQRQEIVQHDTPQRQPPMIASQDNGKTISRHLCTDSEGRPIEITITIDLKPF